MSHELKEFSELLDEHFEIEDINIETGDFWNIVLLKMMGEV